MQGHPFKVHAGGHGSREEVNSVGLENRTSPWVCEAEPIPLRKDSLDDETSLKEQSFLEEEAGQGWDLCEQRHQHQHYQGLWAHKTSRWRHIVKLSSYTWKAGSHMDSHMDEGQTSSTNHSRLTFVSMGFLPVSGWPCVLSKVQAEERKEGKNQPILAFQTLFKFFKLICRAIPRNAS